MTDEAVVDMAPFLARHDRMTRLIFNAMIVTSLALSAAIYFRFQANIAGLPEAPRWPPFLFMAVIIAPFSIFSLWIAGKWYGSTRPPARPDGSFPMGVDDARNTRRVANAGAVFVTGYGLVMIAIQMFWALRIYGFLAPSDFDATTGFRALLLVVAGLMVYFGNVGPRLPVSRAPETRPAVRMKWNRLSCWMTVIFGVLLAIAALTTPGDELIGAVGGLAILMTIVMGIGGVLYDRDLKSPTT